MKNHIFGLFQMLGILEEKKISLYFLQIFLARSNNTILFQTQMKDLLSSNCSRFIIGKFINFGQVCK